MSWIRSSKSTALLVLLVVSVAAVGTAAAVTVSSTDAPEEAEVGEEITVSMTITDLYEEDDSWTLNGTTQLGNVSGWTVTKIQPNGNEEVISDQFEGQQSFDVDITSEENLAEVQVEITGNVPAIEQPSYRPRQTFTAASLSRVRGDNAEEINTVSVHHYTNESRSARNAIADAEEAVNASGSSDAEETLQSAINVYEGENYDEATNLAQDAQETAESAQESEETMQLILIGVGVVVVVLLIGGGVYYWRSQQQDYDKLR